MYLSSTNIYDIIITTSTLLTLLYASVSDVKSREVHELIWIPPLLISITLNIIQGTYSNIRMLAFSLLPALLIFILSIANLMGGADALALLLIGLAHPKFLLIPISFIALIVSLIPPLILMLSYLIINIIKYSSIFKEIKCINGVKSKYLLMFLGKPISIKSYLTSKFLYPLTIPKISGFHCRTMFSNDEVEEKIRNEILELVNKGLIDSNSKIIVTPALPHILFILLGYIVGILIPQQVLFDFVRRLFTGV